MLFVGAAGGSDNETSSSSDLTDSETASESGSDDDLEMHQVRPLQKLLNLHTLQVCVLWLCCGLTCCFCNVFALHCPRGPALRRARSELCCMFGVNYCWVNQPWATPACTGQQRFPACCPLAAAAGCQDGPSPYWRPESEVLLHPSTAQAAAPPLCQPWGQPSI